MPYTDTVSPPTDSLPEEKETIQPPSDPIYNRRGRTSVLCRHDARCPMPSARPRAGDLGGGMRPKSVDGVRVEPLVFAWRACSVVNAARGTGEGGGAAGGEGVFLGIWLTWWWR